MQQPMTITGGCYCGSIRYEVTAEPQAQIQCHCRECQYITGGHPNAFAVFPDEAFSWTKEAPASFSRPDLDNPVTRYFCQTCGTGLGTKSPARPDSTIIKAGTLDDPSTFKAQAAIFTCDAPPCHVLPEGVPAFDKRPG